MKKNTEWNWYLWNKRKFYEKDRYQKIFRVKFISIKKKESLFGEKNVKVFEKRWNFEKKSYN